MQCRVDDAASQSVFVQTVDQDRVITSGELRYVSTIQQHDPTDVIYRMRFVPRFGDLFVGRDLNRKWNQR